MSQPLEDGLLRVAILLLAALSLMVGMQEAKALGRVNLFSTVSGVVLNHGAPIAGAVIKRKVYWSWKNENISDQTTTDARGRFEFPPIWRRSLLGAILPHEPVVEQEILIEHDGRQYVAWRYNKRTYDENDELYGRPIELRCSLENEAVRHHLKLHHVKHDIYGICELPIAAQP